MPELITVAGQPSYHLARGGTEAYVTRTGGQLGPVTFKFDHREISPFHVAPWSDNPPNDEPNIIKALRGDFFCMPFGGNEVAHGSERYPVHGETANENWDLDDLGKGSLKMSLRTKIRPGLVTKEIALDDAAIYSRHTIREMAGPMSFGHHAMLRFKSEGFVSASPFLFGQVCPFPFEDPAKGGYTSLRQSACFDTLEQVLMANGDSADLSCYPAREGFEDLVMLVSDEDQEFAWTAVVYPSEHYLWLCLKDPRVLTGTVLWHSNGGRHYAPWSSRHRAVLGLEEVTSYFHAGLAQSASENDLTRQGFRTCFNLVPSKPLTVNTIMSVFEIPSGFDHVAEVEPESGGVRLYSRSGISVDIPLDLRFLFGSTP